MDLAMWKTLPCPVCTKPWFSLQHQEKQKWQAFFPSMTCGNCTVLIEQMPFHDNLFI